MFKISCICSSYKLDKESFFQEKYASFPSTKLIYFYYFLSALNKSHNLIVKLACLFIIFLLSPSINMSMVICKK